MLHLLHLMLELGQVEMLVLGAAVLRLAEPGEQLKVPLALVARLQDGQVFQSLYSGIVTKSRLACEVK